MIEALQAQNLQRPDIPWDNIWDLADRVWNFHHCDRKLGGTVAKMVTRVKAWVEEQRKQGAGTK